MYKPDHNQPSPSGTTISYQLYRLSEWLWSKEIRRNFHEIVSYVLTHDLDPFKTDQVNENVEFIKKIIGNDTNDKEIFRFYLRLVTLARIKRKYPEILQQLEKKGSSIYNYKSLECTLLTHFFRNWYYGEHSTASSCILLVPRISRVLSFESSETNLGNLSQLDGLTLTNVQIYAAFNRIRGLKNRSWSKIENLDMLNQTKFLCRTIKDIKIIHNSRLLRYMSFIPTPGDESRKFQVGQYFAVLGNISGLKYRSQTGPSDVKMSLIQDFSDKMTFQIRDLQIIESVDNPMNKDVKKWFGVESIEIENEVSLNYNGYVFAIGFWSIEESHPWLIQITPLGQHIEPALLSTYNASAYLNTRKKMSTAIISLIFPYADYSLSNLLFEKDNVTYYIEPSWDKQVFEGQLDLITSGRFNIPVSSHDGNEQQIVLSSDDVTRHRKSEVEQLYDYFQINSDYLTLYSAIGGSMEFSRMHHLRQDEVCHECGSELYELTPRSIQELAGKHAAEILVDFSMDYGQLQMLGTTVSVIIGDIERIISQKDERMDSGFISDMKASGIQDCDNRGYGVENMAKLEFLRDALACMSSPLIDGKKTVLGDLTHDLGFRKKYKIQFSINSAAGDTLLISRRLELFNPTSVWITSSTINEKIILGKICPMGHIVEDTVISRSGIMSFIESRRISLASKERIQVFLESFKNLKKIGSEWFDVTSNAIMRKLPVSMSDKRKISEGLEKIVNSLSKFCPLEFYGDVINSSELQKLEINNIAFLLICKQIKDGKFTSPDDLGKILRFVTKFESLIDDSAAAQSGVINDADSLLRAIALRYIRFHYDKALGNSLQIIPENDFYNYDLMPLLLRCLELTGRQKNLYRNLQRIDPSSRIFELLCAKILVGEIKNINSANAFLKTIPSYLYQKPETVHVKHKKPENVPRHRFSSEKKIVRKESPIRSPPVRISEFGELYYTWKRLQNAKSKTHQPFLYQEIKKEFQKDYDRVVSSLKDVEPSFRKLMGLNVDSKMVNGIFREIGVQEKFSAEGILEIVRKILF